METTLKLLQTNMTVSIGNRQIVFLLKMQVAAVLSLPYRRYRRRHWEIIHLSVIVNHGRTKFREMRLQERHESIVDIRSMDFAHVRFRIHLVKRSANITQVDAVVLFLRLTALIHLHTIDATRSQEPMLDHPFPNNADSSVSFCGPAVAPPVHVGAPLARTAAGPFGSTSSSCGGSSSSGSALSGAGGALVRCRRWRKQLLAAPH